MALLFCYQNHILVLVFLCYVIFVAGEAAETEAVGYGYVVLRSAATDSSSSLTADPGLIKSSSVYGPDIQNLNLFAGYVFKLISQ